MQNSRILKQTVGSLDKHNKKLSSSLGQGIPTTLTIKNRTFFIAAVETIFDVLFMTSRLPNDEWMR